MRSRLPQNKGGLSESWDGVNILLELNAISEHMSNKDNSSLE